MTNKLRLRSTMLTVFLATLVASRVALAVDEVEPNDPYPQNQPQALTVGGDGTVTVYGSLAIALHRDWDFYSFYGHAGDVVPRDVDGGIEPNFTAVGSCLAVVVL